MTQQEFRNSLLNSEPPSNLSVALAGLWWDAKGDWRRAHESAQQDEGPDGRRMLAANFRGWCLTKGPESGDSRPFLDVLLAL